MKTITKIGIALTVCGGASLLAILCFLFGFANVLTIFGLFVAAVLLLTGLSILSQ